MIQAIYWILAILVMVILLINGIYTLITTRRSDRYFKKQEALIDRQMRDMFKQDLDEISKLLDSLKNESEEK